MSIPMLSSQSLFARADGGSSSVIRRQQLEQSVQQFEGLLWGEVAQAMNAVKMGRSTLGYGGQAYQRMMWRRIAQTDFAKVDRGLTRATVHQLLGQGGQAADATPANDAAAAASSPATHAGGSSAHTWIHDIWHAVKSAANALGVPVEGLLAQAALETGWGAHASAHNIFGVKAHGAGPSFQALTHEFSNGVMHRVRTRFQHYASIQHAVDDFVSVLKSAHSNVVGQPTVADYAQALQASGYATDPRYAAKVEAVARSPRMAELLAQVKQ